MHGWKLVGRCLVGARVAACYVLLATAFNEPIATGGRGGVAMGARGQVLFLLAVVVAFLRVFGDKDDVDTGRESVVVAPIGGHETVMEDADFIYDFDGLA